MNETGESTASILRRDDANAWPRVYCALRDGATLYRPTGLSKYYTRCKDPRDPDDGIGISARFVKEQAEFGLLIRCGVDEYQLNPDRHAQPAEKAAEQLGLF